MTNMAKNDMYYRPDRKPMSAFTQVETILHQICNLNKVGSAELETSLDIPHLDRAQDTLHEIIHRLASDALLHLDDAERNAGKAT